MDEKPDTLLKSALEKIVYFEARSDQLTRDLDNAHLELSKLRGDVAAASQREIELRRLVAEFEVRMRRAHEEREEFGRTVDVLRRERTDLIAKMLEASRIQVAGNNDEAEHIDLARFIAELRSEVLLRAPSAPSATALLPDKVEAAPAEVAAPVAAFEPLPPVHSELPSVRIAQEFKAQGRLDVSDAQVAQLHGATRFPGRTEETLFGFSVRELAAPDAAARARAAERLKALGQNAAAPALATALHGETEAVALVAMLQAFATFAKVEGVPVVAPHLTSKHPDVRIAALRALMSMDAAQAAPHLSAAVKDPDRAVRRRAALMALGLRGEAALALGEEAIKDGDAEVRALAALVLGASAAPGARAFLQTAMRDVDLKVRTAAAQSLSRMLGHDVTGVVGLSDVQRRREVRRIALLPANPVRATLTKKSAVAVVEAEVAAPAKPFIDEVLCSNVMVELRSSIRGRPLDQLAAGTRASAEDTFRALKVLETRGHIVQRGAKYFVA